MNPKQEKVSFAQEIQQTDLGKFFYDNKMIVLTILLLLVVGGLGTLVLNRIKVTDQREFDDRLTSFREVELKKFDEGKLSVQELFKEGQDLLRPYKSEEFIGPFLLELSQKLYDKNEFLKVEELLTPYVDQLSRSKQIYFLLNLQLVASYEDQEKYDEAIAVLNKLSSLKVMEAKIYFDLGRNYKKASAIDKAKTSFEYVTKNFPNTQYSKLASLMLSEL